MTNSVLSEALKEAYAAAPTSVVIIETLEIRHPDFINDTGLAGPIRLVNEHTDVSAFLEADAPVDAGREVIFRALAFKISLPNVEDRAASEVNISIDNINRKFTQNIELAIESQKPIRVTYRPYLSTDLTEPHFNPPLHLTLTNLVVNLTSVSGRARFGDLSNQSFPSELYDPDRFPALVR